MVTYTHFGKQPDVLKHLILCEVLRNEAPQVYVETNSACAIYFMTQTRSSNMVSIISWRKQMMTNL